MNFTKVTTFKALEQCVQHILQVKPAFVTMDTEFVRQITYWPQLCLIQLAGPGGVYLIDVLEENPKNPLDLSPLRPLLTDPSIVKVFHSARQDYEIFYHLLKVLPQPLFDTQIAAMIAGYGDGVGYERLVEALLNQKIDKSSQYTDWARRPLSEKQIDYAIQDVVVLVQLYEILTQSLTKQKRWAWLEEEIAILMAMETYETDPQMAWQRLRLSKRTSRIFGRAQDLAAWRETMAQTHNISRPQILADAVLIALSTKPLAELEAIKTLIVESRKGRRLPPLPFSVGQMAERVQDILNQSEVRLIQTCPPDKKKVLSEKARLVLKALKKEVAIRAEALHIPSRILAPKGALESAAIAISCGEGLPTDSVLLAGWRREQIGEALLTFSLSEPVSDEEASPPV